MVLETIKIGNWTNSTVKTLEFLDEKNKNGEKPKFSNIPPGSIRNWLYVLAKGGYINKNSDGFSMNPQGLKLLEELKSKNLPKRQRRKNNKEDQQSLKDYKGNESLCALKIKGSSFQYENSLNFSDTLKVLDYIDRLKKKTIKIYSF